MKLISLFLLFTLVSCGEDFRAYSNNELGEERSDTSNLPDFSTRLSLNLLIEGRKCFGGETVESQGRVFSCTLGQWLVVVDNLNSCTPEGCTEIEVLPVIGILNRSSVLNDVEFYDIEAIIPVAQEISDILSGVTVQFARSQAPRVQFK